MRKALVIIRHNSSWALLSAFVHLEATLRFLKLALLLLLNGKLGEEQGGCYQRRHRTHDSQAKGPACKDEREPSLDTRRTHNTNQ